MIDLFILLLKLSISYRTIANYIRLLIGLYDSWWTSVTSPDCWVVKFFYSWTSFPLHYFQYYLSHEYDLFHSSHLIGLVGLLWLYITTNKFLNNMRFQNALPPCYRIYCMHLHCHIVFYMGLRLITKKQQHNIKQNKQLCVY